MTKEMNKELRELLQVVAEGNNDLWNETIEASKKILAGGYEGHQEDVEALEGVETGFELERLLSQGKWYWQLEGQSTDKLTNLCPDCNVYCSKRFVDGRCE